MKWPGATIAQSNGWKRLEAIVGLRLDRDIPMVAVVVLSIVGIHEEVSVAQDDDGSVDQPVALLPPLGPLMSKVVVPRIVPVPGADPCFGAPAMTNARCALWNPDLPLKPSIHGFARDFAGSGGPARCGGD